MTNEETYVLVRLASTLDAAKNTITTLRRDLLCEDLELLGAEEQDAILMALSHLEIGAMGLKIIARRAREDVAEARGENRRQEIPEPAHVREMLDP